MNVLFSLCRDRSSALLAPVAASLDMNESDLMFQTKESKGKENSVAFRRFFLDLSLAPDGVDIEDDQVSLLAFYSSCVLIFRDWLLSEKGRKGQ